MQDLLSIILLSYQSEDLIRKAVDEIYHIMSEADINFELIIMDDGSTDNSFLIAKELEKGNKEIRAYQLSKNWGSLANAHAGLSKCRGSLATLLHDDLQLPVQVVVAGYRLWQKGEKLIFPIRKTRNDNWTTKLSANLYYALMNLFSDIKLPKFGIDGWLIDREIVDILLENFPKDNTISIELLSRGFTPCYLPFDRVASKGKSRWTNKKRILLAYNTFFGSSTRLMKTISWVGLLIFVSCLLVMLLFVAIKIFGQSQLLGFTVQGWTTTIVFITMFNGLILFFIGIIAEYIWRIYCEIKTLPGNIIKHKKKFHE